MLATRTGADVRVAYLEAMPPSLPEVLDSLAAAGTRSARVVPVFFAAGGHVKSDLPRLVGAAREKHPRLHVEIDSPVGEQDAVLEAVAAAIAGG